MKIEYNARRFNVTDAFESFVAKRMQKVQKYLGEEGDVRLNLEEQRSTQIAEIVVHLHGDVVRSQAKADDMREAFMDAVHKLDVQLSKKQKKLKEKKRREAHRMENEWQMRVIMRGQGFEAEEEQTITTSRLEIRPMSVDEAVTLMEKQGDDFILFRDRSEGAVRFIHRRKDGNYNLIIPE